MLRCSGVPSKFFQQNREWCSASKCNAFCLFLPTIVPLERLPAVSQSAGLQHGVGPELLSTTARSTNSLDSFISDSQFWIIILNERSTSLNWRKSLCLQVCILMSASTVLVGWCQISEARKIRLLFKHPILLASPIFSIHRAQQIPSLFYLTRHWWCRSSVVCR